MPFYEIKANGRFYDIVYFESNKKAVEVKQYFQQWLKIQNIKITKRFSP